MQIKSIPASRPVDWYKQGWTLFAKDMKTWVLMALVMGIGGFVLNFLPILGQIAILVLLPALIGGLLYSAQQASEGKPLKLEYLWKVLLDKDKRNQFLGLGGILFGLAAMVGIISVVFVGDSLLRGATAGVGGIGIGGVLFLLIVGFASFVLFYYTTALMLFRELSLFDALTLCASTAVTQVVPLFVLFLMYSVLSLVAVIPLGLGLLVLIPVTAGAVFVSYKEIF
ncbi:BPSS1780 family membrane protein [Thiothrix lacustris]|uniref:BPSS1780 family membrane protein n=1 Tax=Thiothrix lacustris TaxID=525917 RepID=UPI0027E3BD61|nr:BPSS1780 family membrane protein [Thiothrix lacustris]WMP16412.1 BPSS1780 family membrane protein [Thiothrix lacustris]